MKVSSLLLVAGSLLTASVADAQNSHMYFFHFDGVCYTTNAAGKLQAAHVTERTLLQEKANDASADASGMAIVYHVNGNDLGDTVEIVNASSGQVLDTLLGLYFSQAFSRVGITNSVGSEERRLDYLYTDQDAHSMGAANVHRIYFNLGNGAASQRMFVQGHMDWVRAVEPAKGGSRMYSGYFRTAGLFTPKSG